MRGYYAIIGERPYELPQLSLTKASKIMGEELDHTEVELRPDKKSVTVKVTVSNLTRETWTNKQLVEMLKDFLRQNKITSITKLSTYYTVYVEYELWDELCGECVDHGVGVRNVNPQTFQFPLGLNAENEYVARLGFELPVSFTQQYRPKHPYGMMRHTTCAPQYSLTIKRIWITQLMERAWSLQPNHCLHKPRPNHYLHSDCVCECGSAVAVQGQSSPAWGRPYNMHDKDCGVGPIGSPDVKNCHDGSDHHHHHPSCNVPCPPSEDIGLDPKDLIVVYDTADTTQEFTEVPLTFAPESITVSFTAKTLAPILVNKEEIVTLLDNIKQEIIDADAKPPVQPPENPDDTDKPIEGEDKDQTIPGTKPEKPNPDEGETADPNAPIAGDDKDIGEGKLPEGGNDGTTDSDDNSTEPTPTPGTEGEGTTTPEETV